MELRYDLKEITHPVTRLGVHGLHRLLMAVQKNPDIYPGIIPSEDLSWEMDSDTITIKFTKPKNLEPLMLEAYSTMEDGAVILPGYERNPSELGFYVTARTHYAVTQIFNGGSSGARRVMSLGNKEEFASQLDPKRTGLLDKLVPLGENNRAKAKFTPNYPYPVNSVATGVTKKWPVKMTSSMEVSRVFHPIYSLWNNKYPKVTPDVAFATYFTPLAYVYSHCVEGPFGVGMDGLTFDQADHFHDIHLYNTKVDRGIKTVGGTVTYIHAGLQVAARALLVALECPENRTYSVVAYPEKTEEGSAFDFYYSGAGTGLYGMFNAALKAIQESDEDPSDGEPNADDIRDGFRVLRKIPLIQRGDDTLLSVYDQIDTNLKVGAPWYMNLGKVAEVERNGRFGLFPWERRTMEVLMKNMSTETEREIMRYGSLLRNALAAALADEGHSDPWQEADEIFARVYMARATHKDSVLNALGRIHNRVVKVSRPWKPDESMIRAVQEQLEINPRRVKSLLLLGATTNFTDNQ